MLFWCLFCILFEIVEYVKVGVIEREVLKLLVKFIFIMKCDILGFEFGE